MFGFKKRRMQLCILLPLVIVGFSLTALWVYGRLEAVCFFNPEIDTQFSPAYTEEAFNSIVIGDSTDKVERILGKPLSKNQIADGSIRFDYSQDGKCWWGDFAWFAREIYFSSGKVSKVNTQPYYD